MSVVVGTGEYTFRVVEDWAKLPPGYVFGDVAAVGIDSRDRVYCFNRGEHPMIVLDREGNYITSWGHDTFDRPHGIHVGPDDTLYCTDDGDHTVRHCTLDGKVLLELGVPGEPAPYVSGEPFNRCTHTALSPTQDLYVSDGYGNARIHKYDPKGRLLLAWGEPGCDPGQFNIPHNIHCDADGWVFVADRENHRVQVFDGKGRYETQWNNLHRPSGLFMTSGTCPICYIGEIGPYQAVNRDMPNLGPRVTITDNKGKVLGRVHSTPSRGTGPGQFVSPHGIAVDSRGDLYVGEVAYTAWSSNFPGVARPSIVRSLQKFEKNPPV